MADDSPGKVQALRAIFAEKNQPLMGMAPPNGKISNRPWKSSIDSPEETITYKEKVIEQRTSQLLTKVLPFPAKKTEVPSNGETCRESNGFLGAPKGPPKPCVGPKPIHVPRQQTRTQYSESIDRLSRTLTKTESVETNDENKTESLLKSQAKSKAVAETIATFMFTSGLNLNQKNSSILGDASNRPISGVIPPQPLPRNNNNNTNTRSNLSDEPVRMNIEDRKDVESLCRTLISSDNYICKSLGSRKFRRKVLPGLDTLGPTPAKPPRPPEALLPEKFRISVTVSSPVKVQGSQPPSHPPPTIPHRTAPQRPTYPCPPRPHTPPPLPPLSSAPAVRSPLTLRQEIEELYEDTLLHENKRPVSLIPEYTQEEEDAEELYNDAEPFDDPPSLAPRKPKEPPPPCPSEYLQPNRLISTEELYQDADEVNEEFYEVMPCDEIPEESDSPVYSNNKKEIEKLRREEEKKSRKELKEKEKRDKEMDKLRRKFGLTGEEVPIDDGLVKSDSRGSRGGDLPVRKGETVLILRMEGNPSGRWLVKNEKGKVGYVELTNIEVDPLSVKSNTPTTGDDICTTPLEKNVNWLSKITACVR